MNEIWKDIKDYENIYQVSNLGQVKRLKSFRKNGASGYYQPEKILKQTDRGNGYLCVHLSKNGKGKIFSTHVLVATAFLEKDDTKNQVNHKNGDRKNNTVDNLEWCTAQENIVHSVKVLKRYIDKSGLKLGSPACIKKNLNITNGKEIFNTYEEIIKFVRKNPKYKDVSVKTIVNGVRGCCTGKYKTSLGYSWRFN